MVKNLPVMRETQVRSLGWEDPLEKGMAPLFLSGEFHGQRSLAGCSPRGFKELDTAERLALFQKGGKIHYAFQEILCRGITKAGFLVNLTCSYLCVTSAEILWPHLGTSRESSLSFVYFLSPLVFIALCLCSILT